jgi:ABC-type phosphate transport system substrate-binding protein
MKNIRLLTIGILTCWLTSQVMLVHAELVVIVNPHSNFNSLTKGELRRIFLGQTGNYPNGEPAIPYDVAGVYQNMFYQTILLKTPEWVENYWASMIFTGKAHPPRQVQPYNVKQQIATTLRAISYIDRSQVDSSVKTINIINGQ